jgi:hypothetical protein
MARSLISRAAERIRPGTPQPPLVVLGTGGSGTRAVAEIMRAAGVYLGPKMNRSSDSLALKPFLVRWSQPFVAESHWVEAVERDPANGILEPPEEAIADLKAGIADQRTGIPSKGSLWGWKNPRTINLLPVLTAVAPDAVTAQLVRDGRDMAYSKNQHDLEDCAAIVPEELRDAPDPVRSIALWSRLNLAALAYMNERSGGNHLVVRYEDLCADPAENAERLLTHLGVPFTDEVLEQAKELVKLSSSAGRWREAPPAEIAAVQAAGSEGLRAFGYI